MSATPDTLVPEDPRAEKRKRVAEAMSARLEPAVFTADMPEIRDLPESQLDALLAHYGSASAIVY
jgi:hypothetical protein